MSMLPNFWNQDNYTPQTDWGTLSDSKASQASQAAQASQGGGSSPLGGAENLGWLGGPKGMAAMMALQMVSQAAERQRKERLMQYESKLQKLRSQQQAASAGQQMAQSLRF
jgi:hypothetical protein